MPKRTVAIVGASAERGKFSNKAIRAYLKQGWEVFPVNPKGGLIENLDVYASLRDIPVAIDRVSLYLPPAVGLKILSEIAAVHHREFYVNPGAESEELLAESQRLGLDPILACSIIEVGETPGNFAD